MGIFKDPDSTDNDLVPWGTSRDPDDYDPPPSRPDAGYEYVRSLLTTISHLEHQRDRLIAELETYRGKKNA